MHFIFVSSVKTYQLCDFRVHEGQQRLAVRFESLRVRDLCPCMCVFVRVGTRVYMHTKTMITFEHVNVFLYCKQTHG